MDEFDSRFARGQFTRVGMGLFAFIAANFAAQILAVVLITVIDRSLLYQDWVSVLIGMFSTYVVGIPVGIGIMRGGPKSVFQPTAKMGVKDLLLAFCVMYGITVAGNYIGTTLMTFTERIFKKEILNPVQTDYDGWTFWLNIIMILVLAPVLEELLFRKCVIDAVLPYGEKAAILLSAFSFGFAHGNFFQFFYSAGVGLLFAYIYIRTGKIRNTMILHCALNFVGGFIPLLIMDWTEQLTALVETNDTSQILAGMNAMGLKVVAVLAFTFSMLGIAIAGIIVLIVNRKKFTLNKPAMQIPSDKWFTTVFVNVGTILFVALACFLFISNIFA